MLRNNTMKLSIVDTDVSVEGTISGKGRLIVKGAVEGRIEGETVIIAKEGRAASEAKVKSMTISGIFDGEIEAEGQVVITSSGKCSGKISCRDIIIENGGTLNAEVMSTGTSLLESTGKRQKKTNKVLLENNKKVAEDTSA